MTYSQLLPWFFFPDIPSSLNRQGRPVARPRFSRRVSLGVPTQEPIIVSHISAAAYGFTAVPASPPAPRLTDPVPAWLAGPGPFEAWTDGSCAPNPGPG